MNWKSVLLAFVSLFLPSMLVGAQLVAVVAAQRTVGVSPGDWGEYSYFWDGNATIPLDEISWANTSVLEISGGTNITFRSRVRYDATEETQLGFVDVDTGQGNGTGSFVAAGLNEDDLIYTSPPLDSFFVGATINETVFREYLGESVEVNLLNLTVSEVIPIVGNVTTTFVVYWCRATGMMVEAYYYQLVELVGGGIMWWEMDCEIVDVIPEFPSVLGLPLLMIATLTVVWLVKTMWSTKKSIEEPFRCV